MLRSPAKDALANFRERGNSRKSFLAGTISSALTLKGKKPAYAVVLVAPEASCSNCFCLRAQPARIFPSMLTAISTAHDAGVGVYGDYNDLECLHATIHHLCGHPNVEEHLGEFALGFAYEVRKSFEGARETKYLGTGRKRVKYFGAKNLWPFYLVQVGLLRDFAKRQPTSAVHHSQLYLLEHITEKALAEKNPETARFCREWLNHFPGLTRDYITLFMNEATYRFVFKTPPKKRLESLPAILRSFHWFSDEYRAFEKQVREEARKQGCAPQSLGIKRDWPDFKW